MKDKVNVTLFKGISFDIEGHMELKNAIEHTLNTPEEKNKTVIPDNNENDNTKNITK